MQQDKQHNQATRAICWSTASPHTHSGTQSSQSPRNPRCILQNIPAVLWSCAGCLLFLLPSPPCTQSTASAIFRNPLVAAGRFSPAGTSAGLQGREQGSRRLVARALLIRSSPLPYILWVYILACVVAWIQTGTYIAYSLFSLFSASLRSCNHFVVALSLFSPTALRGHNELCCKGKRNVQGMMTTILHLTQGSSSNFTLCSPAFLVHMLGKNIYK